MAVLTVLVAEDNADDYLLLEYAFKRANFEARRMRVRDGLEAKAYLAGEGDFGNRQTSPLPALILADLKMPRMNGLELLQWTRNQPVLKRIPFVLLSASASPLDITAAYESFANCYHVKPSRLEDLIELMRKMADYWFKASARPEIPMSNAEKRESEGKVGS
jgi:CheY-like chemotaxis protein